MSRGARAAICLALALRLPAVAAPAWSDDEATYEALGRALVDGGVLYVDAVDHKPPGLAWTYGACLAAAEAIGHPGWGIGIAHLLGALAAAATVWGLGHLAARLTPAAPPGLAGGLYAALSTACCPFDGLAVNGELLLNAASTLGMAAAAAGGRRRGLAAGVGLGIAALFKWQALAALPALVVLAGRRRAGWSLVGLAATLAAAAAPFVAHDALPEALAWGLAFNLHYIGDGPGFGFALQRLGLALAGVVLPAGLLWAGGVAGLAGRRRAPVAAALRLWALAALAVVPLGGRFFGHYFLQPEAPLALLAAAPVAAWARRAPRLVWWAAAAPTAAFALVAWWPPSWQPSLPRATPPWPAVGAAVRAHAGAGEALFVWGNAPQVYHHAALPLGTRFAFCNYQTGLSPATPSEHRPEVRPSRHLAASWPLLLADLDRRQPALWLDTAAAGWKGYGKFPIADYPALAARLADAYEPVADIDGARLYRRRAEGPPPGAPPTP